MHHPLRPAIFPFARGRLGVVLFLLAGIGAASAADQGPAVQWVAVDFNRTVGDFDPSFWASSGLIQDYSAPVFRQDIQQIGSVPYAEPHWLRPHDLLDLVTGSGFGTPAASYDWARLDRALDAALAAGLRPFFELMGNPAKHFTDFLNRDQLYAWKQLVRDLGRHLEARYGRSEVRSWYFESWNEPDINFEWKWKTAEEHHHYYDACSEGLKEADPRLRLGGPGISRRKMPHSDFLQAFLDHCDTGVNYFTGERGVRLDFISFHCKFTPERMVDAEVANLNDIIQRHLKYARLPMINDEADSEVGWSERKYEYRATSWYAAFIARSVHEHLVRIADGGSITGGRKIDYRMSNDDAFWGPWIYRTQLARFGSDTHFALIKKPSHTVRTALALLGDRRCEVSGAPLGGGVGAIATRLGRDQVAVLLYHYSDDPAATGSAAVRIDLKNLPFSVGRMALYRIDSAHEDTYGEWRKLGSPEVPSESQIELLRSRQELAVAEPIAEIKGRQWSRTIDLPLPGVAVLVISRDPGRGSHPLMGVYTETYPSLSGAAEDVMIRWKSGSRYTKTYEVLCAPAPSGPFTRVNASDQLDTGYVYSHPPGTGGYVKIRAIDYWDRVSGESDPVAIGRSAP